MTHRDQPVGKRSLGVAVLGAGQVGGDLVHQLTAQAARLELLLVSDHDPHAAGLQRALDLGVSVSYGGVAAVVQDARVDLVFDATTAAAHREHAPQLARAGKTVIDLTPAVVGALVVPLVNLTEHLHSENLSLATSAVQAAVPVVRELASLGELSYVEVVSVLASTSVGSGMRQDIDECTVATRLALTEIAGARRAKAITVLSPAEPPAPMRLALYCVLGSHVDGDQATESVRDAVGDYHERLPGYDLVGTPQLETRDTPWGRRTVLTVRLEVAGTERHGDLCPGNVEVMTVAARDLAVELACERVAVNRLVGIS